jgi:hypothetical protein
MALGVATIKIPSDADVSQLYAADTMQNLLNNLNPEQRKSVIKVRTAIQNGMSTFMPKITDPIPQGAVTKGMSPMQNGQYGNWSTTAAPTVAPIVTQSPPTTAAPQPKSGPAPSPPATKPGRRRWRRGGRGGGSISITTNGPYYAPGYMMRPSYSRYGGVNVNPSAYGRNGYGAGLQQGSAGTQGYGSQYSQYNQAASQAAASTAAAGTIMGLPSTTFLMLAGAAGIGLFFFLEK